VKHKSLKILQLPYQFLMTQLYRTFMMTVLTDLKKNIFYEFGTLFHCFNDHSLN